MRLTVQRHCDAGHSRCRLPDRQNLLSIPRSRGALSLSFSLSPAVTEFCAAALPRCRRAACSCRVAIGALALTEAITHSASASVCCDQRPLPSVRSVLASIVHSTSRPQRPGTGKVQSAGAAPVTRTARTVFADSSQQGAHTNSYNELSRGWLCAGRRRASLWTGVVDSLTAATVCDSNGQSSNSRFCR